MTRIWLGSIAALLTGAGLTWGQAPVPTTWSPPADSPAASETSSAADILPLSATYLPSPDSVAVPQYPNPTNMWAPSCNPSGGSVYLSRPDTDHTRLWFQAEYLLWWIRPGSLPPVVGTVPTNLAATGSLPSDSIEPLFGSFSNSLDYHEQSGLRFNLGGWFDANEEWGADASFFQLQQKSEGASFASSGDPVIGPVFFDPNTNTRNIILASLPQFTSGPLANQQRSAAIEGQSNNRLWSVEANVRKQIGAVFFADHLDLLVGFRYLDFSEGIDLTTDSTPLPGNTSPSALHIEDHLGVHNQFYGSQVGLSSHTQAGRWSFDMIGKLALGDMHETSSIAGSTQLTGPGLNVTSNTGVLAEPTNIGKPTADRFAVMPELTFNVGYQVIQNVRVTVGYNFLYINSVMRAGDLVDGVDARQVRSLSSFDPTAPVTRPEYQQHDTRFWAQGLNFGVEVRY